VESGMYGKIVVPFAILNEITLLTHNFVLVFSGARLTFDECRICQSS